MSKDKLDAFLESLNEANNDEEVLMTMTFHEESDTLLVDIKSFTSGSKNYFQTFNMSDDGSGKKLKFVQKLLSSIVRTLEKNLESTEDRATRDNKLNRKKELQRMKVR